MICPNCGYEMPDGHLLCEKCGSEINIVPEFEIEVENSIIETLSTLVDDIEPAKNVKKESENDVINKSSDKESDEFDDEFFNDIKTAELIKNQFSKKSAAIIFLSIVILLAAIIVGGLLIYWNYSVNYQLGMSRRMIESGRYDKALIYVEKGISLKNDNVELLYEKVRILFASGDDENAMDIALKCIDSKNMNSDTKIKFYDLIISNYIADGSYEEISRLLNECTDDDVKEYFCNFMSVTPEFSIPTGNYESDTLLTISCVGDGNIFYTIDGTMPSKTHGNLYEGTITLEKGEYDFKAVYINKYDVESEVGSAYYLIDVEKPKEPVVIPESGDYTSEFTIKATALSMSDCIYYTDDGTDPTVETGILYTEPIKPVVGKSNYAFVCVSEDGIMSDIVKRSYDFDLKANMTKEEASVYLLNDLFLAGKISDRSGKSNDGKGNYSFSYNSLIEISGHGYYYILDEFYTEISSGKKQRTQFTYAVNPYTGEGYYLLPDETGNLGLVPLG